MKFYCEILVKTVVMSCLPAVFLMYFCLPSYLNYTARQTFMAETTEDYEERMLPAVTVWSQEEDTDLLYHNIQDTTLLHYHSSRF